MAGQNQQNGQRAYRDTNIVVFTGRVGTDPALRYTPNGMPVCQIRVAIAEGEKTSWVTVVTFNKVAETANQYLKKGRKVLIEGRLHTNEWEAQDGSRRARVEVYANRVRFLDVPKAGVPEGAEGLEEGEPVPDEEDIPF